MPQKTFYPNVDDVAKARKWHVIDLDGFVLGRAATKAASLLKGKHKVFFTPNVDCGDFVLATNAAKVRFTGNKLDQKEYFAHSGYPGGAKVTPLKRQMEKDPTKVFYLAVKRMLDSNRFRDRQLARLKIYADAKHPHAAQLAAGTGKGAGKERAKADG